MNRRSSRSDRLATVATNASNFRLDQIKWIELLPRQRAGIQMLVPYGKDLRRQFDARRPAVLP
ncbi:MAG: hypothetical protein KatS3mg105_3879 [Gemmatales bacterium]|nr:MAG: hypothetical protein KatS3mg105_3879 [Gemmatales bacterium]